MRNRLESLGRSQVIERLPREVAQHRKRNHSNGNRINHRRFHLNRGRLRQTSHPEPPSARRAEHKERQEKDDQDIVPQRFHDASIEKGIHAAHAAASGTVDSRELVKSARRIEPELLRMISPQEQQSERNPEDHRQAQR